MKKFFILILFLVSAHFLSASARIQCEFEAVLEKPGKESLPSVFVIRKIRNSGGHDRTSCLRYQAIVREEVILLLPSDLKKGDSILISFTNETSEEVDDSGRVGKLHSSSLWKFLRKKKFLDHFF